MKKIFDIPFVDSLDFAREMDLLDPLAPYREEFHLPGQENGEPYLYFCGNSLGLQPRRSEAALKQELDDWAHLGVEGHVHARNPWMPYHEFLTQAMAAVVGAHPLEVVVMNTLSVNLHLMMVSFYRPSPKRYKIVIEADAFPSDKFAVASQVRFHGFDPETSLVELKPREGEHCLRMEDIATIIDREGEEIALVMLGNTNYYTGQFFDMKEITRLAHAKGAKVGFDCAHGAGNVELNLHDSGADFAVWCSYKYLNSGPGSLAGCFVHERHAYDKEIPRFEGWWGHNKDTRFEMRDGFDPIPGVEAWQLSNPPILSLAAVKASLELFDEVGMSNLRKKSLKLTGYLEFLLERMGKEVVRVISPKKPEERGCQLSIQVKNGYKALFHTVSDMGVIADWREPDVIRIAPTPFYNSYVEVFRFVEILKTALSSH